VFDSSVGRWTVLEHTLEDSSWVKGAAASGYYDEGQLTSTGWAVLDIAAQPDTSAGGLPMAMYALGYLEAHFTCRRMEQFIGNFMPGMFKKGHPEDNLVEWVETQLAWMRAEVEGSQPSSEDYSYWVAVGGVLQQFDGMIAGYSDSCPDAKPLTVLDLLLLNLNGDLFDVIPALSMNTSATWRMNFRTGEPSRDIDRPAHCSASVKLVPGQQDGTFSDLFVGHATWDTFANAYPRIFKHVTVPIFRAPHEYESHTASFSSSPGFLSSIDDFYSVSGHTRLFVQETSIGLINEERYKLLAPQTVPSFVRSVVANRLATSAEDWCNVFSKKHSGTYIDQWMVVDRSRFSPGSLEGVTGLLWILEEAPGAVIARDMTAHLVETGYWASFNVAFFPEMREYMGYTEAVKEKGDEYSFHNCTRARLFRELLPQVSNLIDMQWLMRWNDLSDPLTNGNPVRAIAARGDLKAPATPNGKKSAFGAIDSKVASWQGVELGGAVAHAIAGPTREQQPMFCWTDEFTEVHKGHPTCFNMTHLEVPRSSWLQSAPVSFLQQLQHNPRSVVKRR